MILRTRNERVLYSALELVCKKVNPELAGLMVDSAIVQADEQISHLPKAWVGFSMQVAQVNGQPTPEDL